MTLLVLAGAAPAVGRRTFGPYDLLLGAGERVAILGASGAGKSTLLRLLAQELAPRQGSVLLDGRSLAQWTRPALARRRAVLPQSHAVAFGLPVDLVVALGRVARKPDPRQNEVVAAALDLAQAGHLRERRFDTLSGGEQSRVQLARVFAQLWDERDGLLLVDEPLAALDPGLAVDLMAALQHYTRERGHALVAVLHDINQALGNFERLWLLKQGRLVGDLPAAPASVGALASLYDIALRCLPDGEGGIVVVPARRSVADTARSVESRA